MTADTGVHYEMPLTESPEDPVILRQAMPDWLLGEAMAILDEDRHQWLSTVESFASTWTHCGNWHGHCGSRKPNHRAVYQYPR